MTFEEELDLVESVQDSEHAEVALRQYLMPLVANIASVYKKAGFSERELVIAGYEHFDFAVRRYLCRIETFLEEDIEPYKFSSYFAWFARQGVLSFIDDDE